MKLLLVCVLLLLLPDLAWAQQQQQGSPLSLTPPPTDLSYIYLTNLFSGLLPGSGSQILGQLFGVYNSAILVLGGIVFLYILFIGTLASAHEGQLLGKRWSSIWIPLRSIGGIALLIPTASGYSFIQIFMMWVIVQGVGAADSVWGAALDYFTRGGNVIQQNTSVQGGGNNNKLMHRAGDILRSLVCIDMLEKQVQAYTISQGNTPPTDNSFYASVMAQFVGAGATTTIYFPGSVTSYGSLNGACGNVHWDPVALPGYMLKNGVVKPAYANVEQQIENSRTIAVQDMVSTLYPTAAAIVNNFILQYATPSQTPQVLGQVVNTNPMTWGGGTSAAPLPYLISTGTVLSDAAVKYLGDMSATLNLLHSGSNERDWMDDARKVGWIMAGTYYYNIVAINNRVQGTTESSLPNTYAPPDDLTPLISGALGGKNYPYTQRVNALLNPSSPTDDTAVGSDGPFITGQLNFGGSLNYGAVTVTSSYSKSKVGGKVGSQLMAIVSGGLSEIIGGFYDMMKAQSTNANPVLSLAILGSGLVNTVISTIILIVVTIAIIAAIAAAAFGFAAVGVVIAIAIPLVAFMVPIFLVLMVVGLIMAFYIPFIPFIIFTFGSIGWFISVIEAILAAPLVALGIAHPEGKEILGKAEDAVLLLVNVFLRPTFMIFGLITGMMLSYIGIWLLNEGFLQAYNGYTGSSSAPVAGFAGLFIPLFMLIMYVIMVQEIVKKSFELIYLIPDQVLRWIGGRNLQGMGGEAQVLQTVGAGMESAAQKTGETTTTQLAKLGGAETQAIYKAMKDKEGGGGGGGKGKGEEKGDKGEAGGEPPGGGDAGGGADIGAALG